FKVAVAMKQKRIVVDGQLRDTAVDRAANRFATPPKVEKDARGIGPGGRSALEILLHFQVLAKEIPLTFILRALKQFELMKSRQDDVVALNRGFQRFASLSGAVAQHVDPDGSVDENHPRSFRIAL